MADSNDDGVQLNNGDIVATGRITGAKVKVANALDLEVGSSATLGSLLDAKISKPANESGATDKFLKKTASGTEWATVQSGPSIVTEFPDEPSNDNVPGTLLVKNSLDNIDLTGGGSINGDLDVEGSVSAMTVSAGGASLASDGQGNACVFVDGWNATNQLTITHTGSSDETLTQRIVRDANVAGQISADKTHAVSISATGVNPISPTAATGNVDVSSLFSGANTSYAGTVMPIEAGGSTSVKTYIDTLIGTANSDLEDALGGN